VQTLQSLQAWDVSVLAVSGLQFDLSTPHGKMIASVMAALAEFERDLLRERIKSGIAAAKARGKRLGRQPGQRPSDRKATKVFKLAEAGLSYRSIGRHVGLSKNTVGAILQRARAAKPTKALGPRVLCQGRKRPAQHPCAAWPLGLEVTQSRPRAGRP
jgi:DNA invertase Pin-like site-specific DNA recombinase